jgi:hypothetical protein
MLVVGTHQARCRDLAGLTDCPRRTGYLTSWLPTIAFKQSWQSGRKKSSYLAQPTSKQGRALFDFAGLVLGRKVHRSEEHMTLPSWLGRFEYWLDYAPAVLDDVPVHLDMFLFNMSTFLTTVLFIMSTFQFINPPKNLSRDNHTSVPLSVRVVI